MNELFSMRPYEGLVHHIITIISIGHLNPAVLTGELAVPCGLKSAIRRGDRTGKGRRVRRQPRKQSCERPVPRNIWP